LFETKRPACYRPDDHNKPAKNYLIFGTFLHIYFVQYKQNQPSIFGRYSFFRKLKNALNTAAISSQYCQIGGSSHVGLPVASVRTIF